MLFLTALEEGDVYRLKVYFALICLFLLSLPYTTECKDP